MSFRERNFNFSSRFKRPFNELKNSRTTLGLSCSVRWGVSVIYAGERLDIERIEIEEDRSRERQAGADIWWQKVRYILCMSNVCRFAMNAIFWVHI